MAANDSAVALAGQRALESSDSRLTQPHRPAGLVGLLEFFHLAEENGSGVFSRLNSAVGLDVS